MLLRNPEYSVPRCNCAPRNAERVVKNLIKCAGAEEFEGDGSDGGNFGWFGL